MCMGAWWCNARPLLPPQCQGHPASSQVLDRDYSSSNLGPTLSDVRDTRHCFWPSTVSLVDRHSFNRACAVHLHVTVVHDAVGCYHKDRICNSAAAAADDVGLQCTFMYIASWYACLANSCVKLCALCPPQMRQSFFEETTSANIGVHLGHQGM